MPNYQLIWKESMQRALYFKYSFMLV